MSQLASRGHASPTARNSDQSPLIDMHRQNPLTSNTPGLWMKPAEMATAVRVQDGKPLVTDGPFADSKEVLGGYFVLQADNIDQAIEIAARIPQARLGGGVEIRPTVGQQG